MGSERKQLDLLSMDAPAPRPVAVPAVPTLEGAELSDDASRSAAAVASRTREDAGRTSEDDAVRDEARDDEVRDEARDDDEHDDDEREEDLDGDDAGDVGAAGGDEADGSLDDDDGDDEERDDEGREEAFDDERRERDARIVSPRGEAGLRAITPRQSMALGCVLGGAIGDAMGHPTEFLSMVEIRRRYGPAGVTGFELYWDRGGARFAPYTDDTQMAEVVLRTLIESREAGEDLDACMRRMASGFVRWAAKPQGGHRAPGNACLSGCRALSQGVHWSKAGGETAGGCGSVMRAYPFGLVFADDLRRCEEWSVAHSKLTHRDPIALAASAAMAVGVARVVRGDRDDVVLSEMVAAACRQSPKTAKMMAQAIEEALDGVGPEVTLDRNRGWAAHEAIAAAVYVVARHPDDARAAIIEGANTPGDSDSIATLAGSLVGARVGVAGLPAEWVRDVERTDDLAALALAI
jgi:ADP-ribosylglycohydrolase